MSEIFGDNQKQTPRKTNFVLKSAFLIAAFILGGNFIAAKTGITEELSKIFYWPSDGYVAGEYTVRMAAAGGPNFYPSYPKIMRQNAAAPTTRRTSSDYSDGSAPLIFSEYDAVAFSGLSIKDPAAQAFAQEIKSYNPQTIILGFLNSMMRMPASAPDDYMGAGSYFSYNKTETGAPIKSLHYGGLANFTKRDAGPYAIKNGNDGHYDGLSSADVVYFDGVLYPDGRSGFSPTDLCDPEPADYPRKIGRYTNLDFNENGVADIRDAPNSCNGTEEGIKNINERWRVGYDARLVREKGVGRQISGRDWKIVINDGGPPIADTVSPNNFKNLVDGFMFENAPQWQDLKNRILDWDKNGKKPSLVNWIDTVGRSLASWTKDGQNYFQGMRFKLGTAMMGDVYYGLCLGEGNVLCFWYDEFDADLGQPTGPAQELGKYCKKLCPWGDCPNYCPMVRFFEKGAVIINPSGNDVIITDGDLKALTGYAGPYYRFYGGQDPTINNGKIFDSITLKSTVDDPIKEQKKLTSGDGIILVKNENTFLVSDLVVGNSRHDDTTPGNKPASLTGSWGRELTQGRDTDGKGNQYYTQFAGDWLTKQDPAINDGYPAIFTADPSAVATFTPNIGLAGEYEVFEWHGWHGPIPNDDEATSVSIEIKHQGGIENKMITQRDKYGQWNSLGKYNFNLGEDGYIKILATGASASNVVIADAIKFVFTGASVGPSVQNLAADLNCDKKVDVVDLGILLSCWDINYKADCVNPTITAICNKSPDIVISGSVDINDFGLMLSCWGNNTSDKCKIINSP